MMKRFLLFLAVSAPVAVNAQQLLSLDECRQMAISKNQALDQERTELEMAAYDRKIAAANYFPKISAIGAYQYVGGDFSLVDDTRIPEFASLGTQVQNGYNANVQQLMQMMQANPALMQLVGSSPALQTLVGGLSSLDLQTAIGGIGAQVDEAIDKAIHPDISNVFLGAVSLQQPVFMGGKIVAANKIAALAEELARSKYNGSYDEVLVAVDQAYWQVPSSGIFSKLI